VKSHAIDDRDRNGWGRWFRAALWLGIIQDFALGVPAIFWPNATLEFFGLRPGPDPVWVAYASIVVVVLGAMYVPAAFQPYRYRTVAWLSVLARPPGVVFFFVLYPGVYPLFGTIDLVLTLIQVPLLLLAFYGPKRTVPPPTVPQLDPKAQSALEYSGASFNQVRDTVWSDPYPDLPYHLALGPLKPITFFNHSSRNLSDRRDLLPRFDKLIHANGICHSGVWEITKDSPYTGYFATGSKGLVIARLSVAGLTVSRGTRRAFGIAGKIFPTMDRAAIVYPGNFVTVSHLSGVRTKHIVDIEVTNRPTIGLDPFANIVNRIIFRLMDTRPGFRQLHPISTLGVRYGRPVRTPDLMLLKIAEGTPRVDAKDFREELRVQRYPGGKIVFVIFVRNFSDSAWNELGTLTLTDDVISESGDKRLHFWIPRDIPD
jgi:hypothetical protein